MYGGFIIKPVGVIKLDITFLNKKISDVDFYVVSSNKCMPLLGLESCRQLQLIISVNSVEHASILSESQFLNKNKDVFSGLGSFPGELSLKVNKRTAIPVSNPARRVPFKLMDKLQKTLDDLESKKIIAKSEPSEWCSILVILEKKSGDLRLCIDPKDLNPHLVRDYYQIPTLDQLSYEIGSKKFYCVFDLKDGFYQVKLDEPSSKLCAFSTPFGTYRFLRAPFGLSVLPEHFQKLTQNLFGKISGVNVYFDDIIASANSKEELNIIVSEIIKIARSNNIKFNPDKIQYFVQEVSYLGMNMKFNSSGMKADEARVLSIKNFSH